mmetsp:Transcript_7445/g.12607  ORF Transcript_7445/g.12607 Transcript_7445/m.12607 type:complete len:212 (+) Transcript_7445:935-1570(+)
MYASSPWRSSGELNACRQAPRCSMAGGAVCSAGSRRSTRVTRGCSRLSLQLLPLPTAKSLLLGSPPLCPSPSPSSSPPPSVPSSPSKPSTSRSSSPLRVERFHLCGIGSDKSLNGSCAHETFPHARHTTVERSVPPKTSSMIVVGSAAARTEESTEESVESAGVRDSLAEVALLFPCSGFVNCTSRFTSSLRIPSSSCRSTSCESCSARPA